MKSSHTEVEIHDKEKESHEKRSPSRTLLTFPKTSDAGDNERPSCSPYPKFQENTPAAFTQNGDVLSSVASSDCRTHSSAGENHSSGSTRNGIGPLSDATDPGSDVRLLWLQRDDGQAALQEGRSRAGNETPLESLFTPQYRPLPCLQMPVGPNVPGEVMVDSSGAISNHLFAFNHCPVNPTVATGTVEHQHEPGLPFRSDACQISLNASSLPSTNQNQHSEPSTSQSQESGPAEQRHLLPHGCVFCARRFAHLCQLRIHERVHTGERPYQCARCGKSFGQFCSLKRHQMVHTGEKPYRCPQCGKQFSTSNNLKVHQSVHTGEKRFHCSHCGKNFSFLSNLIRHQAIHASK